MRKVPQKNNMTRKTIFRKAISDYFGEHPGKETWRKVYSVIRGGNDKLNEEEAHAVFCIKSNLGDKEYREGLK